MTEQVPFCKFRIESKGCCVFYHIMSCTGTFEILLDVFSINYKNFLRLYADLLQTSFHYNDQSVKTKK